MGQCDESSLSTTLEATSAAVVATIQIDKVGGHEMSRNDNGSVESGTAARHHRPQQQQQQQRRRRRPPSCDSSSASDSIHCTNAIDDIGDDYDDYDYYGGDDDKDDDGNVSYNADGGDGGGGGIIDELHEQDIADAAAAIVAAVVASSSSPPSSLSLSAPPPSPVTTMPRMTSRAESKQQQQQQPQQQLPPPSTTFQPKLATITLLPKNFFHLNEYCQDAIFHYLTVDDAAAAWSTDDRFERAARNRFCRSRLCSFPAHYLTAYPDHIRQAFYETCGARATKAEFRGASLAELLSALHHFKRLEQLTLYEIFVSHADIWKASVTACNPLYAYERMGGGDDDDEEMRNASTLVRHLPKRLERLRLFDCDIPHTLLSAWFVALDPTLYELHVGVQGIADRQTHDLDTRCFEGALDKLNNLTRLAVYGTHTVGQPLVDLIWRNQSRLEVLLLQGNYYERCHQYPTEAADLGYRLREVLYGLRHLVELTLSNYEWELMRARNDANELVPWYGPRYNLWPHLHTLILDRISPRVLDIVGCRDTLRQLSIAYPKDVRLEFGVLQQFQHVDVLRLIDINWEWPIHLDGLCRMKNVRRLNLSHGYFRHYGDLLHVLRELPNVQSLTVQRANFGVSELHDFSRNLDELAYVLTTTQRRLIKLRLQLNDRLPEHAYTLGRSRFRNLGRRYYGPYRAIRQKLSLPDAAAAAPATTTETNCQ